MALQFTLLEDLTPKADIFLFTALWVVLGRFCSSVIWNMLWSLCTVAYRGGKFGGSNHPPPPEIPKSLQNRAKLNPIVKTVKNCWI